MRLALLVSILSLLLLSTSSEAAVSTFGEGRNTSTDQISCLVTSSVIDAADRERWMAVFESRDVTNPTYICYTATCTVAGAVFELSAGTANSKGKASFSIPYEWTGAISCISVGGTVVLQFTEVKQ